VSTGRLYRRALSIEYVMIGYNCVEAVVALTAGKAAGSIALVAFGLDSIVESLSSLILVWRLSRHQKVSEEEEERIENLATRFVGVTFLLLAAYVLFESTRKIVLLQAPEFSLPGLILAAASVVVMPVLGYAKYRIGKTLGLRSLVADAKETAVCAILSVALLVGLAANRLFGLWIADPAVGLLIVFFLIREGVELVRGGEE
jgi:divalent metal cation (Fe/Co/Zn/Cd) transporter